MYLGQRTRQTNPGRLGRSDEITNSMIMAASNEVENQTFDAVF